MNPREAHLEFLKARIRSVPDFPKPGILFYDITTLMKDPQGFRSAVDAMAAPYGAGQVDIVVGIESRGFIFGAAVADRIGAGFAPVRKIGKLPSTTRRTTYDLEYGTDSLEIHEDAVSAGQRVLIVDDLLATGGTAAATGGLVRGLGADVVAVQVLIELLALGGRSKLVEERVNAVLAY
ncbi:MAG: adenine phosphoribosyltransferase [Acidimicrobiia bacterium]|nr:adenine phosphoribosyltransferase [Acidimicrobiia bacterium]